MTRLTEKQARQLLGDKYPEKPKKYNSRKTELDGIIFDSKAESEYYCELKIRVKAGEILGFDLQPEYILQEGFSHQGKRYQAIKYKADFLIRYSDGREEVIDVKGYKTKEYNIKKKLLLKRYPDLIFKEVYK